MEEDLEKRKNKLKNKLFSWVKDNYDKVLIILLIVAFVIRILIFLKTANQPLWWDEGDYLSAAKKWGLGLNIRDMWYYRRGFLWPAVSAIFFTLGLGEIGLRFFTVLLSTGLVALSYFIIAKMFDKKTALLVSIGMAFSWISLFCTSRILTEIPATILLLLSLLFFWKGYVLKQGNKFLYFFGVLYALSLLVRFQFSMFAFPFLVFIFTREKFKFLKNKHIWITVGLVFVVLLPFFIMYWTHYGNIFTDILSHYFGVQGVSNNAGYLERTSATLFNYFKDLPYMLTKSIFVLFILGVFLFFQDMIFGIDKIFKNEDIQKKLFVFLWIVVSFLVLGYITDYVEQRYILPTLPFIFLVAISPLIKLGDILNKYYQKISKRTAYILSVLVLLLLLIFSFGNIQSNYSWANSLIDMKLSSYSEIRQAGLWIKDNSNPEDVIISQSYPQITYYAERSTYSPNYKGTGISGLEEMINELKPKYYMLSAIERSEDWTYTYPQNNSDLVPVWIYPQDSQQPSLIIYEFKYS